MTNDYHRQHKETRREFVERQIGRLNLQGPPDPFADRKRKSMEEWCKEHDAFWNIQGPFSPETMAKMGMTYTAGDDAEARDD